MTKEEAIKYLQQLYPNGGHCWLDEQRIEAIGMAIKALQEEPVCIWHDASKEIPTQGSNILMVRKEEEDTNYPPIAGCFHGTNSRLDGRNWGYYNGFCYNEIEPPLKWAYVDDLLNLSNVQKTVKDWKEPVSEDLEEASKEWLRPQLDKSYANYGETKMMELTHFDGYAMLDAIEFGAKWQKKQDQETIELAEDHAMLAGMEKMKEQMMKDIWKPANVDDLPEIDREVIAILDNGKVVFAHRPNPEGWDAKSIITEKVERYIPETYGKGCWNIPNVKYWLDVLLPKEIEEL